MQTEAWSIVGPGFLCLLKIYFEYVLTISKRRVPLSCSHTQTKDPAGRQPIETMFFQIHSSYSSNHKEAGAFPTGRVWSHQELGERLPSYELAHTMVTDYVAANGTPADVAEWAEAQTLSVRVHVAVVGKGNNKPGLETIYIQEISEQPVTVSLEWND